MGADDHRELVWLHTTFRRNGLQWSPRKPPTGLDKRCPGCQAGSRELDGWDRSEACRCWIPANCVSKYEKEACGTCIQEKQNLPLFISAQSPFVLALFTFSTPAWLPYCMTLCPRTIFKSSTGLTNLTSSIIYPEVATLTLRRNILDTGCIGNPPWERSSGSLMLMNQAALSATRAHHLQQYVQSCSDNSTTSKCNDPGPMTCLRAVRIPPNAPLHAQPASHMPSLRCLAWDFLLGSAEHPAGTGELQRDLKLNSEP